MALENTLDEEVKKMEKLRINRISLLGILLLTTVLIIVGCKKQATIAEAPEAKCLKPYMQKGNECCLDKNDNKICDEDEKTAEKGFEQAIISGAKQQKCFPPYILKGSECCLDKNKDDECDELPITEGKFKVGDYSYQFSDDMLRGYNKSIRIDSKQCHVISSRVNKITDDIEYYWRPLPIPCKADSDCLEFTKKYDRGLYSYSETYKYFDKYGRNFFCTKYWLVDGAYDKELNE